MRIVLEGWRLLNLILLIAVLTIYNAHHMILSCVTNNNHLLDNNGGNLEMHFSNNRNADGFHREPHIFGHLHMMKTAGTTLNGELALNYERVCGHKVSVIRTTNDGLSSYLLHHLHSLLTLHPTDKNALFIIKPRTRVGHMTHFS